MWNHWNDRVLGWWEHRRDSHVLYLRYEDLQKVCAFKLSLPLTLILKYLNNSDSTSDRDSDNDNNNDTENNSGNCV